MRETTRNQFPRSKDCFFALFSHQRHNYKGRSIRCRKSAEEKYFWPGQVTIDWKTETEDQFGVKRTTKKRLIFNRGECALTGKLILKLGCVDYCRITIGK